MLWSAVAWIIEILYVVVSHNTTRLKMLLHFHSHHIQQTLHWLPMRQGIIFKSLVLVYKYLTTGQPKYFVQICRQHKMLKSKKIYSSRFLIIVLPSINQTSLSILYKSVVNTRCSNPKKYIPPGSSLLFFHP